MSEESLNQPRKINSKFSLIVFINLVPFLYYLDYAKKLYKLGLPKFGKYKPTILFSAFEDWCSIDMWIDWIIYPAIYIIYIVILYRYSGRIEKSINEPFKKLIPIVLPVIFTVVIVGNAALFGSNSNAMIMTKLGWCWGIGLFFFISKFVDFKKLISENKTS
jgi:hypothetical protein